jgi:hypothetical protein
MTNTTEEIMKTITIEHDQRAIASKIGYVIMGFVYAVAAYLVPASIVAFVINSTGDTDLIRLSILIQFIVGLLLSVIAYSTVSNHSLRFGMRVCYGLVVGSLFVIGGYTIFTCLVSL